MEEHIYALEKYAYYLGMSPSEFWKTDYREVQLFCEMNAIRMVENFKQNIGLNDATTDKLIQAHPLNEKSKIIPIWKSFSKLFDKK